MPVLSSWTRWVPGWAAVRAGWPVMWPNRWPAWCRPGAAGLRSGGRGLFMSGVLGAAEADDAARAAAAVGALGGGLHGPVGVVERAAADHGLVTVAQDGGGPFPHV